MPTLLELQRNMRRRSFERGDEAALRCSRSTYRPDRLSIYRNTILSGLTKSLRFPSLLSQRLVGADFFEGAAVLSSQNIRHARPISIGTATNFPTFCSQFPPAASLAYLPDVASLEWAVNCALHARDGTPLELSKLAALSPDEQCGVSFARILPCVCCARTFQSMASGGPYSPG